jgi:hypothetical protein
VTTTQPEIGGEIAYPDWKSRLTLWEVASGQERRRFPWIEDEIKQVVFSADGRTLAALAENGTFVLWDAATGKELYHSLKEHGQAASLAFSLDGKVLVTGRWDSTILLWDVGVLTRRKKTAPVKRLPQQMNALWADLAGADVAKAYEAIWALADSPEQTVAFLKARLKPFWPATPARIVHWIADLKSERFAVRDAATKELTRQGEFAEAALLQALMERPTLEVRHRVEALVQKLEKADRPPEQLRTLRCLEVLEHIGTPEARAVLKTLAQGPPDGSLSQEAQAALQRLSRRLTIKD